MNFIHHGNPFYPLFAKLEVNPAGAADSIQLMNASVFNNFFSYFIGRNFFLTKDIVFNDYAFGGIILGLLPFAFFSSLKKSDIFVFLGIFLFYAVSMILIQPAYSRHIFPSLAFLSILSAAGFSYILNKYARIKYILLFPVLMSFAFHAEDRLISFIDNDARLILGQETEDEYLERNLFSTPTHMDKPIMDYVSENVKNDERILLLYYGRTFYIDKITVFDSYLSEPFVFSETDPVKFLRNLESNNIEYIWYNKKAYDNLSYDPIRRESYKNTIITDSDFQRNYLDLVSFTNDEYLFRIKHFD